MVIASCYCVIVRAECMRFVIEVLGEKWLCMVHNQSLTGSPCIYESREGNGSPDCSPSYGTDVLSCDNLNSSSDGIIAHIQC